jgi:hypothetical protein
VLSICSLGFRRFDIFFFFLKKKKNSCLLVRDIWMIDRNPRYGRKLGMLLDHEAALNVGGVY